MSNPLTTEQAMELGERLRGRLRVLHEDIRQALLSSENETYQALAGQVHDLGEASVADLLSDIEFAVIDLYIREEREIEAALNRTLHGTYGSCVECGLEIGYERLCAYPTATRCLGCQTNYEDKMGSPGGPSL